MRLLTLNIWNASEPLERRFAALKAGLQKLRPDIVCLQEVDRDPLSTQRQSDIIGEVCGLHHRCDYGELSTLSRFPIVRSATADLPPAANDPGPWPALLVECTTDGGPLAVVNTHFTWRIDTLQERVAQAEVLLPAIERFAGRDTRKILCGDFNDDPDSPAIRLVLGSGFRDAFAERHPNDIGLTFSLDNPHVDRRYTRSQRLDYVFAAGGLTIDNCAVVFDGRNGFDLASDHYGVFCTFA